jgi:hypothetical protein
MAWDFETDPTQFTTRAVRDGDDYAEYLEHEVGNQ